MTDTYDKDGNPISMEEWTRLFGDLEYKTIGKSEVGDYRVSTVWLGLNHSYGDGAMLIFETMIFDSDDYSGLFQMRYTTQEQAEIGHRLVVEMLREGCHPGDIHIPKEDLFPEGLN